MSKYLREKSNYDKRPVLPGSNDEGSCWKGWENIIEQLKVACSALDRKKIIVTVECYPGLYQDEILQALENGLSPGQTRLSADAMKPSEQIDQLVYPDITDDEIFGYLSRLHIQDFFDLDKLAQMREAILETNEGVILLYGTGASLLGDADILVYADMPRWEGQLRFRRNEVSNLGVENRTLKGSLQYKRAFFVDWRVCDRLKQHLIEKWDYVLDTVIRDVPKMATGKAVREAFSQAVTRPFRVVPFFDPGPWGGQWMKEVCDLDRSETNFAWCFDCVPEENSLLLRFGDTNFEIPAINLVFFEPEKLLGSAVYARFGKEFPIRFDFLDTIGGGNLSLQVHPTTEYIQEYFGMHYTQEESYYMLDAEDDAFVYLGLKQGVEPEKMIDELRKSQTSGTFDAEQYVGKYPVKKHDHILIPPGTVHCSGTNGMVLEISATPYIFTFKLWDWGRMGLDGKPRPINIERGKHVINWEQTPEVTKKELINVVEKLAEGEGWLEERTGLHQREFIETRRHWFTNTVLHDTRGNLNVLNLVEGREALVESPSKAFEPFLVHYAETFIIPAHVGAYSITPSGETKGRKCATLKAFVRTQP